MYPVVISFNTHRAGIRDVCRPKVAGTQRFAISRRTTRTYLAQLYDEARQKGIKGRSKMNKAQLERAVGR